MLTLHELIHLLSNLMSGDNDIRQNAENLFIQQQDENLYELVSLFLQILRDSNIDLMIRSLAGILLRRILDNGTVNGNKISQDQSSVTSIRNNLLEIWSLERNSLILRRLAHILAQLASNGNWMELIPSLLSHGVNLEGNSLIALLNLIEIIAEYCPDDILTHLSSLVSFLGPHLIQDNSQIQIACAKAVGACIVSAKDEGARDSFKPALQLIIRTLGNALNQGDELDAVTIMEYLVTIAQHQPMFFKGSMDHIVEAMVTVAASNGLDFPTRSIAVELMVTLTETAPALARRCPGLDPLPFLPSLLPFLILFPGLVNGLVPLAMNLMLELEETDQEWASQDYTEEFPDESALVGEEAIERAAAGVGRALVPPIVQIVQEYSNNSDSRYRRAAIAALSRLAEGATKIFKKEYFEASLPFFATCLSDPSPRVQYQAIQAIGQFATLYSQFIPRMISLYFDSLVDFISNPNHNHCDRVRGHAVSALINLCRPQDDEENENDENGDDEKEGNQELQQQLTPEQLDRLLTTLCHAMQTTSIQIQSSCLLLLG
jgi:importin-5